MARKSRIEPRKNISFLSENDFEPKRIKILQNPENCQISRTGKGYERQEITLATKMSSSPFEKLPDEIILKIFSFLSFKSLGNCNRVSHRLKTISQDTSLWKEVKAWLKVIPAGFVEKIVKSKVKHLSIPNCEVFPINLNLLIEHKLDLKSMDISNCDGNDNFLSELVKHSKALEYLDLTESRPNLVHKCIENFDYSNKFKVLCVNEVKLNFKYVKQMIDKCTELTNLGISGVDTPLSQQSIAYICKNLTSDATRVDLAFNNVKDKHIQSLLERCQNLEHLDLRGTKVTYQSVTRIVSVLSHSLVSLLLPENVGVEMGMPSNVCMEKLKIIFDLTKLKNLHIGCEEACLWIPDEAGEIYSDDGHIEILEKHFPKLKIGRGMSELEYEKFNTDPSYFFYIQEITEVELNYFPTNLPRRSHGSQ